MKTLGKITISEVRPPIPTTAFDYCAYIEGTEELLQYGWGSTPAAAHANLLEGFNSGFFVNEPYKGEMK